MITNKHKRKSTKQLLKAMETDLLTKYKKMYDGKDDYLMPDILSSTEENKHFHLKYRKELGIYLLVKEDLRQQGNFNIILIRIGLFITIIVISLCILI